MKDFDLHKTPFLLDLGEFLQRTAQSNDRLSDNVLVSYMVHKYVKLGINRSDRFRVQGLLSNVYARSKIIRRLLLKMYRLI